MARGEAPDVKITEAIQPQAQMHDTYVRPAAAPKSHLHDIADALKNFSSEISGAFTQMSAKQAADDKAAGIVAAYTANKPGEVEAVRTGLIPNFASKAFNEGIEAGRGQMDAVALDGKFGQAYAESNIKTSDDPNAYDNFYATTVKGMVPGNKGHAYNAAIAPALHAIHAKYAGQFSKDRIEYKQVQAETTFTAAMGTTLDQYQKQAAGSENGMDLQGAAKAMVQFRDGAFNMGMEKAKADKLAIDAVVFKAIDMRDERVLSIIGGLKDGTGPELGGKGGEKNPVSLAESAYGRDEIQKAQKAIQAGRHTEAERKHTLQTREDATAKQNAIREIVKVLGKDPNATIPEELLKAGEKTDGDFRVNMVKLKGDIMNGNVQENPEKIAKLHMDIIGGKGMDAFYAAVAAGDIRDPKSIKATYDLIELQEKHAQGDMKITQSGGFERIEKMITTQFVDPSYKGSIWKEAGLTKAGDAALNDARVAAMRWAVANPKATKLEQEVFLQKLGADLRESIKTDAAGKPAYEQPASAARPAEVAPNPALPPGETKSAPQVPQQAPLSQQLLTAPAAPKVQDLVKGGLPQAEFDKFVAESKRLGFPDPQKRLDYMFESIQKHKKALEAPAGQTAPGKRSDVPLDGEQPQAAAFQMPTSADFGPGIGVVDFSNLPPEAVEVIRGAFSTMAPGLLQNASYTQNDPAPTRSATAEAPSEPLRLMDGKDKSHIDGLDGNFRTSLERMVASAPPGIKENLKVLSGYRSEEHQLSLFQRAVKKYGSEAMARKWVAPPGGSNHNHGKAVDLNYNGSKEAQKWVHDNADKFGLHFRMSHEPWHIEPKPGATAVASAPAAPHPFLGAKVDTASITKEAPRLGPKPDNAQAAIAFFRKKGLSAEDSAAIVWNFTQESGKDLDTKMVHDGGTGMGIAGFRDPKPGQGRKSELMAFAKKIGRDPTDLYAQLEFAWSELNSTERQAFAAIRGASTPEAKAQAAIQYFRPYKPYAQDRARRASEVRKYINTEA